MLLIVHVMQNAQMVALNLMLVIHVTLDSVRDKYLVVLRKTIHLENRELATLKKNVSKTDVALLRFQVHQWCHYPKLLDLPSVWTIRF